MSQTFKRISPALIADVLARLRSGEAVRMDLPLGGTLHLDRMLPFLCICRTTSPGLERFVRSEAAYVTAPPHRFYQKGFTQLVRAIVEECTKQTKGFLVVELWEAKLEESPVAHTGSIVPRFTIVSREGHAPEDSLAMLRNSLSRIRVQRVKAKVDMTLRRSPKASGAPVLIPFAVQKRLNCYWIGIEVAPIYRKPEGDDVFPPLHRILHRGITRAIKQTVFAFSHNQTEFRPSTHLVLGPRGVPRNIWTVDKRLAQIGDQIDFLMLSTPVNTNDAWAEFRKNKYKKKPRFFYRPIPFDAALLKRELYRIPVEDLDDPTWANLFQQKRRELDTQLSMLRDRNTANFFHGSMQLYGGVSDDLRDLAEGILEAIPSPISLPADAPSLEPEELKVAAEEMIRSYQASVPDFTPSVVVDPNVAGLIVSRDTFFVGELRAVPDHRVVPLLSHEVGTHLLTYYNACKQPLHLLRAGLPGYDELQEGLAVLAEYLSGGLSPNRMRMLAGRVVGVRMLIDGASFAQVYRRLAKHCRFDGRTAFVMTMRIFRGGGLTKDAVYLRGLTHLLTYLADGHGIEELLVGKLNFEHVPIVRELTARNVLGKSELLPLYLLDAEGRDRLNHVREGITVLELIRRNTP